MTPQIGAGHGESDKRTGYLPPRPDKPLDPPEPAVKGTRRVFVGGPLHGRRAIIPDDSGIVFSLGNDTDLDRLAREQLDPVAYGAEGPWFVADSMISYVPRRIGLVQVMIEVGLTRGPATNLVGLLVDALGQAASVLNETTGVVQVAIKLPSAAGGEQ